MANPVGRQRVPLKPQQAHAPGLPEGRKKYSKTVPLQFEEFAPALAWWNNREEGPQAWKVDFAAKRAAAVEAATPHWQRAEAERNAAIALGKPPRRLSKDTASAGAPV